MASKTTKTTWSWMILTLLLVAACGKEESERTERTNGLAADISADEVKPRKPVSSKLTVPLKAHVLEVTVTEGGKPAVGAEVFIFRQELVSDQEAFREAGRIERWSDRLKPERLAGTADANGRVSAKLPVVGRMRIVARRGGVLADALIDAACTDRLKLDLKASKPLTIKVVDSSGRPQIGVLVGIAASREAPRLFGIRPTGKEGMATFEHPKLWLDPALRGRADYAVVGVAEPFAVPVRKLITQFETPTEVVLPPHSAVVIKVGKLESKAVVHLSVERSKKRPARVLVRRPVHRWHAERVLLADESELRFPFVGLGLNLIAQIRTSARDIRPAVSGKGPTAAGETATIDLPTADPFPQVRCFALDEGGKPLQGLPLSVAFVDRDSLASRYHVVTDADGSFEVPLAQGSLGADGAPPVLSPGFNATVRGPGFRGAWGPDFQRLWHEGAFRMALKQDRLLMAGVVKDGQGKPLQNARVELEMLRKSGYWPMTLGSAHRTDQNGRFVLTGSGLLGIFRVKVSRFDHENAYSSHVPLGSDQIEIRMERKGEVAGSVLVDGRFAGQSLIGLFRERGKKEEHAFPLRRSKDGRLELTGAWLVPGTYDFIISENNVLGRLHKIEAIDIPFRGKQRPDELDAVDLRGKFRHLSLSVVDEKGVPMPHVMVELRSDLRAPVSFLQARGTDASGQVSFLAPLAPLSARVMVEDEEQFSADVPGEGGTHTLKWPEKGR